ncbi:hypothetical protein C8R44DRAFT_353848 [Mycena epipterygia]|nr:hypothetical protein C8R44DRAFT_353848 [Mycena epipterygia]
MQPFVPRPTMISPDSPTPPAPATAPTPPPVDMEVEASENVPPPSPPPPQESNAEPKDATAVAEQPSPPPPVLQPPTLHALAQASSYFTSLPFPSLQNVTTAINRKKQVAAQLKKALHASAAPSSATQSDAAFPAPPPGARTVLNAAQAQTPPARKSSRKSRRAPPQLIVSDARAEHLLIAARRLGRERAGIVAGVISAERERMERLKVERERDRIEKEKERIEREKKNRGGGGYYRERPEPGSSTAAVSETPPTREATRERASSHRYAAAMAGYVSAAGAPAKSEGKGKGKGVPTPLDSLLNAARSMLDNGQDENGAEPPPSASTSSTGTGMMTRRRAANANESASTSAPKRRRLSSPARARTALDVLADQAAVFSNSGAPGKGKGKYSMAEDLAASVVPLVAKRKRGRPPKATPVPMLSKNSRLISPALVVAGPSHQDAVVAHDAGSTNASTSAGANGSGIGIHPRPATKWVQRGRLTSSASSRPPPRQKDDMESEDEEEEGDDEPTAGADEPTATVETEKIAEPELEGDTLEPVVRPTAVATPRPAVDEVPLARQDDTATETAPQPSQLPPPPVPEDPVLDADADGESDPDVDMDGPDATTQSAP